MPHGSDTAVDGDVMVKLLVVSNKSGVRRAVSVKANRAAEGVRCACCGVGHFLHISCKSRPGWQMSLPGRCGAFLARLRMDQMRSRVASMCQKWSRNACQTRPSGRPINNVSSARRWARSSQTPGTSICWRKLPRSNGWLATGLPVCRAESMSRLACRRMPTSLTG